MGYLAFVILVMNLLVKGVYLLFQGVYFVLLGCAFGILDVHILAER